VSGVGPDVHCCDPDYCIQPTHSALLQNLSSQPPHPPYTHHTTHHTQDTAHCTQHTAHNTQNTTNTHTNPTSCATTPHSKRTHGAIHTPPGVPFIHAGDDLLRSKSLDRDSYNSGDHFNRVDWTGSDNNFGVVRFWGVGLLWVGGSEDCD